MSAYGPPGFAGGDSSAAEAFDRIAPEYDGTFGRNPVGLYFRHVFQERLRRLLPPRARVLDLGCGTGEDAVFLAGLGHSVVGVDVSPAMVERARAKAVARGVAARFVVGRAEDLAGIDGPFDATYSDFGALNCADLAAVGGALRRVLAPGAPVVLSFLGPRPLPATLLRALTGRGEPRGREQPRLAGIPVPARYPSAADAQGQLGPGFAWTRAFALGVLAPGPDHAPWAVRHPEAFGALAAIEGRLRGWPVLRGLGDHLVLEGRLTGGPA